MNRRTNSTSTSEPITMAVRLQILFQDEVEFFTTFITIEAAFLNTTHFRSIGVEGGVHTELTNNQHQMRTKIEIRSLLLGSFAGAMAVLCIAAVTTKPNAGAEAASKQLESADTTEGAQLEQVTGIGGVFFKVNDPKGMVGWYRTNLG